jgi:ketosteroid isomerase-like protein
LGKPAIRAWLKGIESAASGSKVVTEEVQFHNLQLSGDWASEWATEHQSIQPQDKPAIDGYGKIALVLHRDHSGQWKIEQEMWNQSPRPPL